MRYDDFLLTFYIRKNHYGSYLALKAAVDDAQKKLEGDYHAGIDAFYQIYIKAPTFPTRYVKDQIGESVRSYANVLGLGCPTVCYPEFIAAIEEHLARYSASGFPLEV